MQVVVILVPLLFGLSFLSGMLGLGDASARSQTRSSPASESENPKIAPPPGRRFVHTRPP